MCYNTCVVTIKHAYLLTAGAFKEKVCRREEDMRKQNQMEVEI